MDAVKYLKEKERMCKTKQYEECPLYSEDELGITVYCDDLQEERPEEAVEMVEKWSAENPQKTILQDFLEKYPNALLRANGTGVPESCCKNLGFGQLGECYKTTCKDCWNRPLEG